MTGTSTLVARTVLGLAGAVASFAAVSSARLKTGTRAKFDRWVMGVFAASRFGLFAVLFLVFGIAPRGDIPAYYVPEAVSALAGKMPYRDFPSSYAPLHSYLDAGLLLAWHSPLMIILFAVFAETALLWTWLRMGRLLLSEERLRLAALLYVASPISFQYVTVDGHDNVLIALLTALSLWLAYRSREGASGALLGVAISGVKFLPLVFAPAFVLGMKRWVRWAAGCAAVVVAVYGAFALRGVPILYPLHAEGAMKGSGNVPYLLEALTGRVVPAGGADAVVVLGLLGIYAVMLRPALGAGRDARLRIVALATVALTLVLLLFAKKSWPPYLMLALFPMCFAIVRKGWSRMRLALWCGFSVVAVVEHSFWASIMQQVEAIELHARLAARDVLGWALLGLEVLLIAGYAWLLIDAVRQIRIEGSGNGSAA